MDEEEIIYSIKASKHTEQLNVEIWLLDKDAETLNKLLTEVGTEVNEVEIEGIKFTEVKNLYDTFHIYDGESGSYVISVHSDLEEGLAEIMNVK